MRIAVRSTQSVRLVVGGLFLGLVTGGLGAIATSVPAAAWKPWGTIRAADQALRVGCHTYRFRYHVDPPRNEWQAEMYVVNPDGVRIAHTVKDGDFDPNRSRVRYTLCKASTRYGVHRLRMKVTWWEDDPAHTAHTGWVKPGRFRLHKPR